MPGFYVYEGNGIDSNGHGLTAEDPFSSLAFALSRQGGGEVIRFKTKKIGRTKPNFAIDAWVKTYYVDPAEGTDSSHHGFGDGTDAYASLQFALDSIACGTPYDDSAWIFCKGLETTGTTIDFDNGAGDGGYKIVEGYTTDPRDGGFYFIRGTGSTSPLIQWRDVPGVALCNLDMANFGTYGLTFNGAGIPGARSGQICWNVYIHDGLVGFSTDNNTASPIMLFCSTRDCTYAASFTGGAPSLIECYFRNNGLVGIYASGEALVLAYKCLGIEGNSFIDSRDAIVTAIGCIAVDMGNGFKSSPTGSGTIGAFLQIGNVVKDTGSEGFFPTTSARGVMFNNLGHGCNPNFANLLVNEGMIEADPLFVDQEGRDFRMKANSPGWVEGLTGMSRVLQDHQYPAIGIHERRPVPIGGGMSYA